MDPQEDLTEQDVVLNVLLPGGQETTAEVHGSKPVMDVLVTLCAQHHLVPSDHVIKLISTNQNHINFKPNSMIGSLEFEKVVLQVKGSDANKKKPHVPVATVRLLINYKKSYKAVVRVNPAVPLAELMPTVCEKCEFDRDATVLLKTEQSEEPLDLSKTLNDYAIRELYAKEVKVVPTNPPVGPLSTHKGAEEEQKTTGKEKKPNEKGNKGLFGLFKKSKKASEQAVTGAPSEPLQLNGQHADGVNGVNGHSASPTTPGDLPKKRRAPQPPMTTQSIACALNTRDSSDLSEIEPAGKEGPLSRISSTESSLKRTKRRAPPPPLDGSTPPVSDNKEEEAQGVCRSSQKHKARVTNHCPQIAKVMSELTKSLQARQQRMLSSANSSASQNSSEEPHTPEAELTALPACQLLRQSSERDGLTTFTVRPQRRPHTEPAESPTTDPIPTELFTNRGRSEHESEVLHLEEEKQVWMKVRSENGEANEEECIHSKNTELKALPGFELMRKNLKTEGFTTFTVIPLRRQQGFEEPVSSQSAETHVCPGVIPTELFTDEDHTSVEKEPSLEVLHLERPAWMDDVKSKNEDECVNIKNSEFKALSVCQQLREGYTAFTAFPQRRTKENVEGSDEEDQCLNPKNTELKSSESLKSSLQHLRSEMEDQEERDVCVIVGNSSPDSKSGVVKREEMEDDVTVEAGEEKDWIEEYKERRRMFLGGAKDCMKELDVWGRIQRELTNTREENMIDEIDSQPPPVCWEENRGENEEDQKNRSEQEMLTCDEVNLNLALRISSKPKFVSFSDYGKPNAHSSLHNAEPNASGARNDCRFASELHRASFLSHPRSSFDPCPPAQVSLFALAVFQKAKRSKPGPDPNCSRRRQLSVNTHSN